MSFKQDYPISAQSGDLIRFRDEKGTYSIRFDRVCNCSCNECGYSHPSHGLGAITVNTKNGVKVLVNELEDSPSGSPSSGYMIVEDPSSGLELFVDYRHFFNRTFEVNR